MIELGSVEELPDSDGRAHQQDGDAGTLTRRNDAEPHDLVQQAREGRCGRPLEAGLALGGPGHHAKRQHCVEDGKANRARAKGTDGAERRGEVRGVVHRRGKAAAASPPVAAPAHAAARFELTGRFSAWTKAVWRPW